MASQFKTILDAILVLKAMCPSFGLRAMMIALRLVNANLRICRRRKTSDPLLEGSLRANQLLGLLRRQV